MTVDHTYNTGANGIKTNGATEANDIPIASENLPPLKPIQETAAFRGKNDIAVRPPYKPESLSESWPLWPAREGWADEVAKHQGLEGSQLLPNCLTRSAAFFQQIFQGRCAPRLENVEGLVHPCICALVPISSATADAVCATFEHCT